VHLLLNYFSQIVTLRDRLTQGTKVFVNHMKGYPRRGQREQKRETATQTSEFIFTEDGL
jgi:hypothetical protein